MQDGKRIFTLGQAQALLPRVQEITREAAGRVENLRAEIEDLPAGERRERLEARLESLLHGWAREVEALGCEVKGLWLVDFDSGDGLYYCWQHPESQLEYFHEYDAGFAGRRRLGPWLSS